MRAFLFGVVGAALAYPVLWHASAPPETAATAPRVQESTLEGAQLPLTWPGVSEPPAARKVTTSERRHLDSGSERAIELPRLPSVSSPAAPLAPLPSALPHALERVTELRQVLADPDELAARVQRMQIDQSELAQLKAFAEMFIELPPDRVERSMSGATGAVAPASRPRSRPPAD
jgi:hypothetical protein